MGRLRTITILIAIAVLGISPVAYAQSSSLNGTVTDDTEAVLPGVTVTAVNDGTGVPTVTVTDGSGGYNFGALQIGTYTVTADLPGFTTVITEGMLMGVGQNATLDFRLSVATLDETVTVSANAPLIDVQQSELGGRIDARQIEALPVLGRNWMGLVMLAPGSRATDVTDSPTGQAGFRSDPGYYQLNLDGMQVTNTMAGSFFGNVRLARDSIAEFEFQSGRFDATSGRSMSIMLNAVSKSGSNLLSGSAFGYFRHDSLIAADHVTGRSLPYSNQQAGFSVGGPIKENDIFFFGYYEGEREPATYVWETAWPSFNIPDLTAARREQKFGLRVDDQLPGGNQRLMARFSAWKDFRPVEGASIANHPSIASDSGFSNYQASIGLTQTFGGNKVHELKVYYHYLTSFRSALGDATGPRVTLPGLTLGKASYLPLNLIGRTYTVRDDFTVLLGNHELKVGGDFVWNNDFYEWNNRRFGELDATGRPVPDNIEQLIPVWDDASTWQLNALSPQSIRYQQSFGDWTWNNFVPYLSGWVQDNYGITSNLTLNLGLRWDYAHNWAAQQWEVLGPTPPSSLVKVKGKNDLTNFGPRLGFAYAAGDMTVIRGGWGKYYAGPKDQWSHHTPVNIQLAIPAAENPGGNLGEGRPDFYVNPYADVFGGALPTLEQAFSSAKDTSGYIAFDDESVMHVPFSYQTSVGFQQQIGSVMSVQADYVYTDARGEQQNWNHNLTYDPATGRNNPYSDVGLRRYDNWGLTSRAFSVGSSDYQALETGWTKRFSNNWQASATYTFSDFTDCDGDPVFGAFALAPDLGGQCSEGTGDQAHRVVLNGIWQAPGGIQASGLYFYGSGARAALTYGVDLSNSGYKSTRLQPDPFGSVPCTAAGALCSLVARNDFVNDAVQRVDIKVARPVQIGRYSVEASFEVFNLFNAQNFASFTTALASPNFGLPLQSFLSAYVPRTAALGVAVKF